MPLLAKFPHCASCKLHMIIAIIATMFGGIITSISASILVEYIVGHPELSAWTGTVPMSSPAAVCLVLTGIALTLLGFDRWKNV